MKTNKTEPHILVSRSIFIEKFLVVVVEMVLFSAFGLFVFDAFKNKTFDRKFVVKESVSFGL